MSLLYRLMPLILIYSLFAIAGYHNVSVIPVGATNIVTQSICYCRVP